MMRTLKRRQVAGNNREDFVPLERHISVGGRVVSHRLRQATLHFQPVVRLRHQVRYCVLFKELPGDPSLGRLKCQCLNAVLAKLQCLPAIRIRESTTWIFEATWLIHRKQCARPFGDDALLEQRFGSRRYSAPKSTLSHQPIDTSAATSLRGTG